MCDPSSAEYIQTCSRRICARGPRILSPWWYAPRMVLLSKQHIETCFALHSDDCRCNTGHLALDMRVCKFAMQVLNNYVASLTQEQHIDAGRVTFWLLEGSSLSRVDAELPAYGSLGPLFHAFGLISDEELQSGAGSYLHGEHRVSVCSCTLQGISFSNLTFCCQILDCNSHSMRVKNEHLALLSTACSSCMTYLAACSRSLDATDSL